MIENIFSLASIDDLPKELKQDINIDTFEQRILYLLNIAKRSLSVDEITVAYYRKFGKEDIKTKKQIVMKIYSMSKEKSPKVIRIKNKKGVYGLNK